MFFFCIQKSTKQLDGSKLLFYRQVTENSYREVLVSSKNQFVCNQCLVWHPSDVTFVKFGCENHSLLLGCSRQKMTVKGTASCAENCLIYQTWGSVLLKAT